MKDLEWLSEIRDEGKLVSCRTTVHVNPAGLRGLRPFQGGDPEISALQCHFPGFSPKFGQCVKGEVLPGSS